MAKHIVELTQKEKEALTEVVSNGKAAAYKIKHANILLLANQAEGGLMKNSNRLRVKYLRLMLCETRRRCYYA